MPGQDREGSAARFEASRRSAPERRAALDALERIADPLTGEGLVTAGRVTDVTVAEGRVTVVLEAPAGEGARYAPVREAASAALQARLGAPAQVVLTAETAPAPAAPAAPAPAAARRPAPTPPGRPRGVRRVIAVGSGKGGVGKSTVAVNLACAFAALGWRSGLLDADIYGPSAPTMLGLAGQPQLGDDKRMLPLGAHGLAVMSLGAITAKGAPLIWRGPMASQALNQMLHETAWDAGGAELDVLVVDLPPGTGDVQLTLVQKTRLDGAVLVTTPQELSLADARRAADMFGKVGVPVLGVVETMSYFPDPASGARIPIFGAGGGAAEAARLGAPLLAELPLDQRLRESGDDGAPLVATAPDAPTSQLFLAAAEALKARLQSV